MTRPSARHAVPELDERRSFARPTTAPYSDAVAREGSRPAPGGR